VFCICWRDSDIWQKRPEMTMLDRDILGRNYWNLDFLIHFWTIHDLVLVRIQNKAAKRKCHIHWNFVWIFLIPILAVSASLHVFSFTYICEINVNDILPQLLLFKCEVFPMTCCSCQHSKRFGNCGLAIDKGDYITNVIKYDYLPHARLRLRITKITMSSITITLKVITIAIAITFVLKHPQKENKTYLHGLM